MLRTIVGPWSAQLGDGPATQFSDFLFVCDTWGLIESVSKVPFSYDHDHDNNNNSSNNSHFCYHYYGTSKELC